VGTDYPKDFRLSKLLFHMGLAITMLFCIAAPSAKATEYSVTLTGGGGDACTGHGSTPGILTISGTTLEFVGDTSFSGGDCYFGAGSSATNGGYLSGSATCTSGPNGHSATCVDLTSLTAGTYTFANNSTEIYNGEGCIDSAVCAPEGDGKGDVSGEFNNFTLTLPSNFLTGGSAALAVGNTGIGNTYFVDFDNPVLITPEPVSYLLFGSGLLVLGAILRKKTGPSRA
jgi:hypothetical protein